MITTLLLLMTINGNHHAYEIDSWAGEHGPQACIEEAKAVAAERDMTYDEIHCEIRGFR